MQKLSNEDFKLLKTLAGLTQESLRRTLASYLKAKYDDVIVKKEYIFAQGNIPIALIAHMDTVFTKPPTRIYYDKEQGVIWSPQGLGADDRAGIFSIIKILSTTALRPSVILTTDEEIGCLGALKLVEDYPKCPIDLNYVIQLDRRGYTDCVFYDCDNPDFVRYVESFGFIEEIGSLSDISAICPDWGMAGVNLSVGYEGEHFETEILHVAPMLATIEKVKKMLSEVDIPKFEYIPCAYSYSLYNKWYNGWNLDPTVGYAVDTEDEEYYCCKCKKHLNEFEAIPATTAMGQEVVFCPDCCVDNVDWCDQCKEGFVIGEGYEEKMTHICPSCRVKMKYKSYKTEG